MKIVTEIRGPRLFGQAGVGRVSGLTRNQPLLLIREPGNPVDGNAVIVADVLGAPMGYLARETAARVAPELDRGEMWLAKALCPMIYAQRNALCMLWKEVGEFKTIKIGHGELTW